MILNSFENDVMTTKVVDVIQLLFNFVIPVMTKNFKLIDCMIPTLLLYTMNRIDNFLYALTIRFYSLNNTAHLLVAILVLLDLSIIILI